MGKSVNTRAAYLPRRARSASLALATAGSITACGSMDEEDEAEFRDGCDGVEEYIDENGEEVICVYTDEPGDAGGDEIDDPCWVNPWLCSGDDWGDSGGGDVDGGGEAGGGDDGGGGGCRDTMFFPVATRTHASQHQARIDAIEAARTQGRAGCRADWYWVGGWGAYCDTGIPDNHPWSNGNSWVRGCEHVTNLGWTCTAESTITCND